MNARELSPLWGKMQPYLKTTDFRVSGAGVRYGSVIYLGFGQAVVQPHPGRRTTNRFPVELEIGADEWSITDDGTMVVQSRFTDPEETRSLLRNLFENRELHGVTIINGAAFLECSGGLTVEMDVGPDPASGFLIAFDAMNAEAWESIDGKSISS